MHKIVNHAIIALVFAVSANPAAAEEKTIQIDYADLDLSSNAATAEVEGRIRAAVRHLCGGPEYRNIKVAQSRQDCRKSAYESAYGQLARILNDQQRIVFATLFARSSRR